MSKFKVGDKCYLSPPDGSTTEIVEVINKKYEAYTVRQSTGNECYVPENWLTEIEKTNIPTVEEMNKIRCRDENYEFHINECLDGFYFGRYKHKGSKHWIGTSWLSGGLNDSKRELDLIEQPKEWHEDIYMYRDKERNRSYPREVQDDYF